MKRVSSLSAWVLRQNAASVDCSNAHVQPERFSDERDALPPLGPSCLSGASLISLAW